MRKYIILYAMLLTVTANSQNRQLILTGADRMEVYVPLLKGKAVGVFANQTSLVGKTHLIDTLLKCGINIVKIYGPEHGFRGDANAGEKVENELDKKTGIPIISLYGKHKKATPDDLKGVDVLLFDIQDIGVRFFTYISSLQYFMEAAFENRKPMMILDRPNPNGFYIDGPVLEKEYASFVGMQPVPIVYGMTMGEYAMMIAGERWLTPAANERHDYYRTAENSPDTAFHFLVIKCKQYDHKSKYELPVRTSPNLPEMKSVYLYPSTALFEGTVLSEGRGTDKPFQYIGHPLLPKKMFSFIPKPTEAARISKCYFRKCYGWDLSGTKEAVLKKVDNKINLKWLLEAFRLFPGKDSFFLKNNWINSLAGNSTLMNQIKSGKTENEIRKSWQPGLIAFKTIRKKYLLYPDFE